MPVNQNIKKFKEEIYNDSIGAEDIECDDERLGYAIGRAFSNCVSVCPYQFKNPTRILFDGENTVGGFKERVIKAWKSSTHKMPYNVKWANKLIAFMLDNAIGREKEKITFDMENMIIMGLCDDGNEKSRNLIKQSKML